MRIHRCKLGRESNSYRSWLNEFAASVVDTMEQALNVVAFEIFIHCATGTLPMSVVVDDDCSTRLYVRVQVLEFVQGRRIPVGIQSQDGNLIRSSCRQC